MKPLDHTRITEEAIRRYVRYSRGPVAPMLLQHSRLVQKGAEDADISPLYTRVTNWHFYNRNLDHDVLQQPIWSFMEPLTVHLSSDRILKKRYDQLKEESSKRSLRDCCNLTGRILHHIQDMSSPSHVVPVFHGPLVPDSFETYLYTTYLAKNDRLSKMLPDEHIDCNHLIPPPETTVLQLYQQAAESTLNLLKPENSHCRAVVNDQPRELPWTYFWADKYTPQEGTYPSECKFSGFGKFGPLGKNFGTTVEIRAGGKRYRIEPEVYDELCSQLVEGMLVNSIRTLFLLEPELEKLC